MRARYIVYPAGLLLILTTVAFAGKKSDRYKPYRPDGALKPVTITIKYDNPDLPPERRERMARRMMITINVTPEKLTITRGEKSAQLKTEDYLKLWKLFRKVDVWELKENAMTTPRPVGVANRIFSLKMEGAGEKFFNVNTPNSKSEKHFKVIKFIEKLCSDYVLP